MIRRPFKLFFVIACVLLGFAFPAMAMAQVIVNDGCADAGGGAADIDTVTASFDDITGDITVIVTLCAPAADKTKYRVHFDHTVPFSTDPDRNGDAFINMDDNCVTTSDDTMMQRGNKRATGPGVIMVVGSVLTYIVNMTELNDQLQIGDAIQIWVDTQNKGNVDRVPDVTASLPGCSKPDSAGEVIQLSLAPLVTTFDTSGEHSFVVPVGVTRLTIRAWGAGGGGWNGSVFGSATGGMGGFVEGELPVVAGDVLVVVVGQGGREASCGGGTPGAGGGGLSGVLNPSYAPLLVAGGGGGGVRNIDGCDAASVCSTVPYVAGGAGFGGPGKASAGTATDGSAGAGAPSFAGGSVGSFNCGGSEGFGGYGGGGGGGGTHNGFGGGGGGGGFPGGAGGIKDDPGFGGSNFADVSATLLNSTAGGSSGGSPNADGSAMDGSDGRVEIE